MARMYFAAIGLSLLIAKGEPPSNIQILVDNIRTAARAERAAVRAETLLQVSTVLRFHFPDEAKRLALESEGDLRDDDDYERSQAYRIMLDVDTSTAAKIAERIRDKNVLYGAELQHCVENHDIRCGLDLLARAHSSGAYRISDTRWVIDRLVATDPAVARSTFTGLLQGFSTNAAGFPDVHVLLEATEAIAKTDLELARRAAKQIRTAVENPGFEARNDEIVTARFIVDSRPIQTTSTRETVLVQVDSFLRHGSFPRQLAMSFQMKHPPVNSLQQTGPDPAIDGLVRKLEDQVQQLNDFALEGLDGRTRRLTALRGRPVLLDFWATWCLPCRKEMPQLEALQTKGLTVFAITDEDEQVVRKFAAANRYGFAILLDPHGEAFKIYDVVPRPTTILIDSTGRISGRWTRLPEGNALSEALGQQPRRP